MQEFAEVILDHHLPEKLAYNFSIQQEHTAYRRNHLVNSVVQCLCVCLPAQVGAVCDGRQARTAC